MSRTGYLQSTQWRVVPLSFSIVMTYCSIIIETYVRVSVYILHMNISHDCLLLVHATALLSIFCPCPSVQYSAPVLLFNILPLSF
jgi:hypothetical protein